MTNMRADVAAVLSTLLRATADGRTPVVLRSGSERRAREVAQWLERMHGGRRIVFVSRTAPADIELRLPSRLPLPLVPRPTAR